MRNLVWLLHMIDSVSDWSGKILSWLVWGMIGIILFEVVARYAFDSPTNWAHESSTMVFGTFAIGAGAYTLFHKGHIRMDLFYTRWSDKTRAIVDVCTFFLFLGFCGVLLWHSAADAWRSVTVLEHTGTPFRPPVYHWKTLIPVAVALMLCQGLSDFIRNLVFAISGRKL